jgi:hypothetical protein
MNLGKFHFTSKLKADQVHVVRRHFVQWPWALVPAFLIYYLDYATVYQTIIIRLTHLVQIAILYQVEQSD